MAVVGEFELATDSTASSSGSGGVLPVDQYVAGLPRKRMAAGVLFRDRLDRVLLVEPTYKENWEVPGGVVEADEAPWEAARRELREEIAWDRLVGRLLVVDYVHPQDNRPEGVVFIFDGGVLDEHDVAAPVLDPGEIRSAGLYTLEEASAKVKPILADRLAATIEAVQEQNTVLCEQGRRIG